MRLLILLGVLVYSLALPAQRELSPEVKQLIHRSNQMGDSLKHSIENAGETHRNPYYGSAPAEHESTLPYWIAGLSALALISAIIWAWRVLRSKKLVIALKPRREAAPDSH